MADAADGTTRRLTVVTPTFHPEPIGTPHYATDLVRWFDARGWDVGVVTAQPFYPDFVRHPGYDRSKRHDHLDGIPVLRLPTFVPPYGKPLGRAVHEANFVAQSLLRVGGRRTSAVLSITPGTPWVTAAARAFRAPGGRHVALVHDVQSGLATSLGIAPGALQGLLRRSERASLQRADAVAVLTPQMGDALRSIGVTRPIHDAPLWATVAVDAERLPPATRSLQYSGNFGAKQGVDLLLPLAAELHRRDPGVELLLRGAGHRFDLLRQQIAAAGLSNVRFTAPVDTADLAGALAGSPVHLVLQAPGSADFAMPSKVVNALACGASVVAVAEPSSPLAKLSGDVLGVHHAEPFDIGMAIDRALQILDAPDVEATRRAVARDAAGRFSRDVVLEGLAGLLDGDGDPAG